MARDGVPVASASWGVAVPVDPGAHLVEAHAPQRKSWSSRVTVPPDASTVVVAVPALEAAATEALAGAAAHHDEAPGTQPSMVGGAHRAGKNELQRALVRRRLGQRPGGAPLKKSVYGLHGRIVADSRRADLVRSLRAQ